MFLGPADNSRNIFVEVFSTITSPSFFEVVIILEGDDVLGVFDIHSNATLFQTLRAMHDVRSFNLVFLLVAICYKRSLRWRLVKGLKVATAKGFLDFLDSPPTIWDKFPDSEV